MKNKEKIPSKKSGVQLPAWLHVVFKNASGVAGYRFVKDAHEEASIDWLRKKAKENAIVKAMLDEEAKKNPEIKLALSGMKITEKLGG